MCGLQRWFSWLVIVLLVAVAGGCSTYYVVKDPETGLSYYTRDIDHAFSGAVKFMDERTGSVVTLQNSNIKEIDEHEYNAGRYSSK